MEAANAKLVDAVRGNDHLVDADASVDHAEALSKEWADRLEQAGHTVETKPSGLVR